MTGKRLGLAAALAILLTSAGCTRSWCEHHGYYPPQGYPATYQQPGCCCCPTPVPPTNYAPPPATWNSPGYTNGCACPPPTH